RNTIRDNYGVKLPYIHIVHNTNLPSDSFVIKIRNMPIFSYNIKLNCNFVIPYSENTEIEFGEKTFLQLLNVYGYWIYEKDINKVDEYGCLIYSVDDLIVLFLEEVVLSNIDKIINRQTIKEFKDIVEKYNKAIIEEINEKQITNDIIQKVVQNLLLEKISVKDFEYILE
ncbi:MAG: flagellar biosynthesis protein FlhA, partial [bacterium]|nr:flagellar biosynthesis protein FlhA [bacterium]